MGSWLEAAQAHADACAPRESCGLVVGGEYLPCRNVAHGDEEFLIAPEDWADAEDRGAIQAVVHSHPGQEPPTPSQADLEAQERMGVEWVILGARTVYHSSLVGRDFEWGTADCYTLVRDWYRLNRYTELPDWPHEHSFWEREETPFEDHYEEAGFRMVQIQDMAAGDVILMRVASRTTNHCAVYLGRGQILHHLMDRKSCVEPLGPWLRRVTGVYRRTK